MPALFLGISRWHFQARRTSVMLVGATVAATVAATLCARTFSKDSTAVEITL